MCFPCNQYSFISTHWYYNLSEYIRMFVLLRSAFLKVYTVTQLSGFIDFRGQRKYWQLISTQHEP